MHFPNWVISENSFFLRTLCSHPHLQVKKLKVRESLSRETIHSGFARDQPGLWFWRDVWSTPFTLRSPQVWIVNDMVILSLCDQNPPEWWQARVAPVHCFFFFFNKFYSFLSALGLHCCVQSISSCGERGLLFVAVRWLRIAVASVVAEHEL